MKHLLLSGASGTLGLPLVASLLAAHPELQITCVLRSARARMAVLDSVPPALRPRLHWIVANLGDGRSVDAALDALAPIGSDAVGVHLAADVAWDKPCADMVPLNVHGTLNFASLLQAWSPRPHMVYVSTAYTRTHDWDYRNGYEESKAQAERCLRERFGERFPISVFSCSLVVGDSRSGAIARFNGLYPLIRFLAGFEPPFLVGNKDGLLDIVPVDWVVSELHGLVRRCAAGAAPADCVAAAGPRRVCYQDVVRLVEQRIALARRAQGLPVLEPVPILRDRQWGFLQRALNQWQPPGLSRTDFRYFERLLKVYGSYANSDRVRAPQQLSTPAPHPFDYLPVVVDHWLSRHPRVLQPRGASLAREPA